MCLAGAKTDSKTSEYLKQILNLTQFNDEKILDLVAESITRLNDSLSLNESFILTEANKMYLNQDKHINSSFINEIVEKFRSEVENLNFANSDESAASINKWCEEKTESKIKNVIKPDEITSQIGCILVNATYFKATWQYPFKSWKTRDAIFCMENGIRKETQIMKMTVHLKICKDIRGLKARVCQLPYKGETMFMSIILPNEDMELNEFVKLSEIEDTIDCLTLKKAFEQECEHLVNINLPKFKVEYNTEVCFFLKNI
jgi:serpin B